MSTYSTIEAPRGEVRSALAAVLPHTGRESDETPDLGRVRFVAGGDELLVWTTDHRTTALARVAHPEYVGDELPSWDMPAGDVKKVLQVFRAPSNPDARSMWEDQPLRIEVGKTTVTFTEVGSIVDGQALKVARIVPAGEDRYPDVPRELATLADAIALEPAPVAVLNAETLARFVSAAKAYSGEVPLITTAAGHGLHRALVRIGQSFLGSAPAYPDTRETPEQTAARNRDKRAWWLRLLEPLQRPVPVPVPAATTDDLAEQAEAILRAAGTTVGLRVVPDPEPGAPA